MNLDPRRMAMIMQGLQRPSQAPQGQMATGQPPMQQQGMQPQPPLQRGAMPPRRF